MIIGLTQYLQEQTDYSNRKSQPENETIHAQLLPNWTCTNIVGDKVYEVSYCPKPDFKGKETPLRMLCPGQMHQK